MIVVRRMVKLDTPFPVDHLIVRSTMKPLGVRTTAGNWAFVLPDPVGIKLPVPTVRATRGWKPPHVPKSSFDTIPNAETAEEGKTTGGSTI